MSNIQLIFADDHKSFRSAVVLFLQRTGQLDVLAEAESGAEALVHARTIPADILLLDMRLPDLDGVAVAQEISRQQLPIKILAFSVYKDEKYVRGIYDCGGSGYLLKSEMPETLLSVLRQVAGGESGFYSLEVAQLLKDAGYPVPDRSLRS